MITDARALRPEFIPRDMVHRQGSIDHMVSIIDPLKWSSSAENISIFGPSGTGKTTLAKYVLRKMERSHLDYRWGYVNCMSESSKTGALHQLLRDCRLGRDIRRAGTPSSEYFERIREFDGVLIFVLDEADVLDQPELIAALSGIEGVSHITICVDQDKLHASLRDQERVRSRLRAAETITLDKYTHSQLSDILRYRVDHGLDSSRVEDEAVEYIADLAAGDARLGIAHLRRAARQVQSGSAEELTVDIVQEVADDAQADLREQRIRYLGTHKRALYDLIKTRGRDGIPSGDLHRQYREQVQNPKVRRTVRRYLDSLERYELVQQVGSTSGTRYSVIE
jgi:Cdc6-like AAA superfamily ATPase